MKYRSLVYVLIIAALFPFISTAQTTRYVDPSGSDSGDCSDLGSPCQSANYAISQSSSGDIIKLSSGTFASATVSTRLTLEGKGSSTIIQGLTINAAESGVDLITISDIKVESGSAHGVEISTSYVTLSGVNSSDHTGRNVNLDASADITNISISDCIFDNGNYGLWIDEDTGIDGLTVLNTSMDGNIIGLYSQFTDASNPNTTTNVVIRNCTFSSNSRKGIYAEKLDNTLIENISVINSGTDASYDFNNGIDINLKWQAYSDITIRNSRILNCGALGINNIAAVPNNRRTSAVAIKARTDATSYSGTPASLSNVTLDGLIIDGQVTDLRFGEMGQPDNDGIDMSTVSVSHCYLVNDNLAGLLNEENTNTLTISNNYWGGGAPSVTDIEDHGTSATTSQSSQLVNVIVDDAHNTYTSFANALSGVSANAVLQNIPTGTISGTTTISQNVTLVTPGAGLLDATNSLTTFENLTVSSILTLGSDFAASSNLTLSGDVVMADYNFDGAAVTVNSGASIQDGLDMVANGGTVTVASGIFSEAIIISEPLVLEGANVGVAGNGSRGTETIIEPSSNVAAITISSSSVTVNGFQVGTNASSSNATTGILSSENDNITISNNIIYANSVGINFNISETGTSTVSDNLIQMLNLVDPLNPGSPSVGLNLQHIRGDANVDVVGNDFSTASYGIFGHDFISSNTALIDGGTYSGCTKGIEINNTDGLGFFNPATIDIQNVTMSGFAGPGGGLSQPDTQAGIYTFVTGNADATDDLIVNIDNVDISGVGSSGADYSAIYIADFQASGPYDGSDDDGIGVTATLSNANLHDNLNRAIYVRGNNADLNVTQCTLTNNGGDPYGTDGNHGFNIVSRAYANGSASNCSFISPGSQASSQFDGLSRQSTAALSISDCFFNQNGNGLLAGNTGIDLSGNSFNTTDQSAISGWVGNNDFTPWLGSATDTDGGTTGFQGDFTDLHVGLLGAQTGSAGRIQEAHDLLIEGGSLSINLGDYGETLTATQNMTLVPLSSGADTVSLDNLVINGSSKILQLSANLRINGAVTNTDGIIQVNSPSAMILGTSASDLSESAPSYSTGIVAIDTRTVGAGSISILGVSLAAGADDLGDVSIQRISGSDGIVVDGSYSSIACNWTITSDNPPAAGRDVDFTWESPFDNGKDLNDMSLFKNEGSGWMYMDGPQVVTVLGDTRTYPTFNTTSFSDWTLAQGDQALPITLSGFSGEQFDNAIHLNWTTLTEFNSDYFSIERSISDDENFQSIGVVQASGDSKERLNYVFVDSQLASWPIVYYRLKMVDIDDTFEYSPMIVLIPDFEADLVGIYPNPTVEYIKIKGMELSQISSLSIYDLRGTMVEQFYSEELSDLSIDLSEMESGHYLLLIESVNMALSKIMFVKE